jgi:hypothetical protein
VIPKPPIRGRAVEVPLVFCSSYLSEDLCKVGLSQAADKVDLGVAPEVAVGTCDPALSRIMLKSESPTPTIEAQNVVGSLIKVARRLVRKLLVGTGNQFPLIVVDRRF